MGKNYNSIRANMLVLIGAIMIMCGALGGSLFIVVNVLKHSTNTIKTQIVPIKHSVRQVSELMNASFIQQNEVVLSQSTKEVDAVKAPREQKKHLDREIQTLGTLLERAKAYDQQRFQSINQHIGQFITYQEELRAAKRSHLSLEASFEERWSSAQRLLSNKEHKVSRLTGLTRLEYVAALNVLQAQAERADYRLTQTALKLTRGDDRAISELLPILGKLDSDFNLIARSIATCDNPDELNSLIANQAKPMLLEIEHAYQVLAHLIPESSPHRALFNEIYEDQKQLIYVVEGDPTGSLISLRAQSIKELAKMRQAQTKVGASTEQLSNDMSWIQSTVAQTLDKLSNNASKRVSQATWLAILSGLAGLIACIIALQRTRIAVSSLDRANTELEKLSCELSVANSSLEQKVDERTRDLHARNQSMRLVMDHVNQGLLTIGLDGTLSNEYSQVVESWLGRPEEGQNLAEYFGQADPMMQGWVELAMESITDGFLPLDVALDQFPKQLQTADRTLHLSFTPIMGDSGECEQLLVIVSDITHELKQRKLEAQQRELLTIFEKVNNDRASFLSFFQEADQMIHRIQGDGLPGPELYRALHTLKGNAGIFGLNTIATLCHDLENKLMDAGGLLYDEDTEDLRSRWQELSGNIERFFGDDQDTIRVKPEDLDTLIDQIWRGMPHMEAARVLTTWKQEPFRLRLEHMAEQALALAERIGKGPVEVLVETDDSRYEPEPWRGFFNSLVHVIRNAIDHGLETLDERIEQGKPETAKLVLSARREQEGYLVGVRDFGRGIDWEKLRAKARDKGLPAETDEDLTSALFSDGVSTRDEVSQISGRGVGMGALKAEVERLGGEIKVYSDKGKGTQFAFWLPAKSVETGRAFPQRSTRASLSQPHPNISIPRGAQGHA